jgi:hypothetical protein
VRNQANLQLRKERFVLDRNTEIRVPHAVTRGKDGHIERTDDPRVSVTMQEQGATVTLFFDRGRALAGDADLLEIRLTPRPSGIFEPWRRGG